MGRVRNLVDAIYWHARWWFIFDCNVLHRLYVIIFLLGIIASFAAFSMKDKQKNVSNAAAISIVVGLSIFVIYYIGIKSLKGNEYDGFYSVLSNLIAFVLAGAVIAFFHHNKRSQKLQMKAIIIPSIVLGLGIFIFQYTVMNEIKKLDYSYMSRFIRFLHCWQINFSFQSSWFLWFLHLFKKKKQARKKVWNNKSILRVIDFV